ncbi:hypothetical protein QQ045_022934 [Rhodiola kirilowii]
MHLFIHLNSICYLLPTSSILPIKRPPSLCSNMTNKTMKKAVVVVTFSVCLALLFGMSHGQQLSAEAPSGDEFKDVQSDEVFVELAPGIIEEITGDTVIILDPRQCREAIGKVTGCILDIFQNLGKGKLDFISPKCCEGFAGINRECWSKLLPFDDFTAGIIKHICSRADAPPPTKVL